jgi:hypothetical protein
MLDAMRQRAELSKQEKNNKQGMLDRVAHR